jgi:hypothetical protein
MDVNRVGVMPIISGEVERLRQRRKGKTIAG